MSKAKTIHKNSRALISQELWRELLSGDAPHKVIFDHGTVRVYKGESVFEFPLHGIGRMSRAMRGKMVSELREQNHRKVAMRNEQVRQQVAKEVASQLMSYVQRSGRRN